MIILDELEDLLLRERGFLKRRQYDELGRLTKEKGRLIAQIKNLRNDVSLTRIRTLAAHNSAILDAAGRGFKAAARQISEIKDGIEGQSTYSESGVRRTLANPSGDFEHKA